MRTQRTCCPRDDRGRLGSIGRKQIVATFFAVLMVVSMPATASAGGSGMTGANASVPDLLSDTLDSVSDLLESGPDGSAHASTPSLPASVNDTDWERTQQECPDPGCITVSIEETNEPVEAGDTLTVDVKISNIGRNTQTGEATLFADGTEQDSAAKSLDVGEQRIVTLEWETSRSDAGSRTIRVRSNEGDDETATVQIEDATEPSELVIDSIETSSPVEEGETLFVDARITNTGGQAGGGPVSLSIDGQSDSELITDLSPGVTETVSLKWETSDGDAGSYAAEIEAPDDSETVSVTVDGPTEEADLTIENVETSSPVEEGETLFVDARITNNGGQAGGGPVSLSVDGQSDSELITDLSPGVTETVSLEWDTSDGDAGSYAAEIEAPDDSETVSVTVDEPAESGVVIRDISTSSPVEAGETMAFDVTVENTGDSSLDDVLSLSVAGEAIYERIRELSPGETRTVSTEWDTSDDDVGSYTADFSTREGGDGQVSVSVNEPTEEAELTIDSIETSAPVVEGETLFVDVQVRNTGGAAGGGPVSLSVGGQSDSELITDLSPGVTETVSLKWDTSDGDAESYTAEIEAPDDSETVSVTVEEPSEDAELTIDSIESSSPVDSGETMVFDVTVTNTGGSVGGSPVSLSVGGESDTEFIFDLSPGVSETVTLEWDTSDGDRGSYTAEIETRNDSQTERVTVEEAVFDAEIETNAPVTEGETLRATGTFTNTGNIDGQRQVSVSVGSEETSRLLDLAPGESSTVVVEWETSSGDAGSYTARADSGDDTARTSAQVEAANAELQIDSIETSSPVDAGETMYFDVRVTNAGNVEGGGPVSVSVAGNSDDEVIRNLQPGQSKTVSLRWNTDDGNGGSYTATIQTPTDKQSVDVRVQEAVFDAEIETNAPVTAGETVRATGTFTNTGEISGQKQVSVELGNRTETALLELSPGESKDLELSWGTQRGDAGTYRAVAESDDDTASTSAEVQNPDSEYVIESVETSSPVDAGETMFFDVTVTNTGTDRGYKPVGLAVDGDDEVDSTFVEIPPGQSQTVSLSWETDGSDSGTYTATIDSADDTTTESVQVGKSSFTIDRIETNSPLDATESLTVTARVTNDGQVAGQQVVNITVGDWTETELLSLESGEQASVSLERTTAVEDEGEYTAVAATGDEERSTPVEIRPAPPEFVVSDLWVSDSELLEGDSFDATATITNVGGTGGRQTMDLRVGDEATQKRISLAPGETTGLELTWETERGDAGEYDVIASTENDTRSNEIEVITSETDYEVEIVETGGPIDEGEWLTPTVAVENVGTVSGRESVELRLFELDDSGDRVGQGEPIGERGVALEAGASEQLQFEWEALRNSAGQYELEAVSPDDRDVAPVEINEADDGAEITIDPDPPVAGHETQIRAISDARAFEWRIDDELVSQERSFTYEFAEPGSTELAVTVTEEDGDQRTETTNVTVQPSVRGTVVGDDGKPVEGALVQVANNKPGLDDPIAQRRTNEDGSFTFEFLDGEARGYMIRAIDYEATELRETMIEPADGETTTVELSLEPMSFDYSPQAPRPGDDIELRTSVPGSAHVWSRNGEQIGVGTEITFTPDAAGEYEVQLNVSRDGVTATPTQTITVEPALQGRVVDYNGDPVEGAQVFVGQSTTPGVDESAPQTTTDEDGTFVVERAPRRAQVKIVKPVDGDKDLVDSKELVWTPEDDLTFELRPENPLLGTELRVEGLSASSQGLLDQRTQQAAGMYVDGHDTFTDTSLFENEETVQQVLEDLMKPYDFYSDLTTLCPPPNCEPDRYELENSLAMTVLDSTASKLVDYAIGMIENGRAERIEEHAEELEGEEWFQNFEHTDSQDEAYNEGFVRSDAYTDAADRIDDTNEQFDEISEDDVDEEFYEPEARNAVHSTLDQQIRGLQGERNRTIVTPKGNTVQTDRTLHQLRPFYQTAGAVKTANELESILELTETTTGALSILFPGAGIISGGARIVKDGVRVQGAIAEARLAAHWTNGFLYWMDDTESIPRVNEDTVDWLESELEDTNAHKVEGQTESVSLQYDEVDTPENNEVVATCEDNYTFWTHRTAEVTVTNTGQVEADTRVTANLQRLDLNKGEQQIMTTQSDLGGEPVTLAPGETETFEIKPLFVVDRTYNDAVTRPLEIDHTLETEIWMNGQVVDQENLEIELRTAASDEHCAAVTDGEPTTQGATAPVPSADSPNETVNRTSLADTTLSPNRTSVEETFAPGERTEEVHFQLFTQRGSDITLEVVDQEGHVTGYDLGEEHEAIPESEYSGTDERLETVVIEAPEGPFTVRAEAQSFTTRDNKSVELVAREVPELPAALAMDVEDTSIAVGEQPTETTVEITELSGDYGVDDLDVRITDDALPVGATAEVNLSGEGGLAPGANRSAVLTVDASGVDDVPADGRYDLELTAEAPGSEPPSVSRTVSVVLVDEPETLSVEDVGPAPDGIALELTNETALPETDAYEPVRAYNATAQGDGSMVLRATDTDPSTHTLVALDDGEYRELPQATTSDNLVTLLDAAQLRSIDALVVASPQKTPASYADPETGIVETDGVRKAVADWQQGEITTDLLLDVIDHWSTGSRAEP